MEKEQRYRPLHRCYCRDMSKHWSINNQKRSNSPFVKKLNCYKRICQLFDNNCTMCFLFNILLVSNRFVTKLWVHRICTQQAVKGISSLYQYILMISSIILGQNYFVVVISLCTPQHAAFRRPTEHVKQKNQAQTRTKYLSRDTRLCNMYV